MGFQDYENFVINQLQTKHKDEKEGARFFLDTLFKSYYIENDAYASNFIRRDNFETVFHHITRLST